MKNLAMDSFNTEFLANQPQHLPRLAQWYFAEWGELTQAASVQVVETRLQEYLNTDRIPLIMIAENAGELMGAVQLKYREMPIYPEKEHWLGGVFVAEQFRHRRVAETLIRKVLALARQMGVDELHLQTIRQDGGLYSRLGWQAVDRINYRGLDVLVMVKKLGRTYD
ncbi:MAG: GNAT family N-acetyltransferase [Pseudomonadota bacterium]